MTNIEQLPIPHAGLDDNLRVLSTVYSIDHYLPFGSLQNSKITVIDSLKYRHESVAFRYCRYDALMKAILYCDACNILIRKNIPNLYDLNKMAFQGHRVLLIITAEDDEGNWTDFLDFDARQEGFNALVTWWK